MKLAICVVMRMQCKSCSVSCFSFKQTVPANVHSCTTHTCMPLSSCPGLASLSNWLREEMFSLNSNNKHNVIVKWLMKPAGFLALRKRGAEVSRIGMKSAH